MPIRFVNGVSHVRKTFGSHSSEIAVQKEIQNAIGKAQEKNARFESKSEPDRLEEQ